MSGIIFDLDGTLIDSAPDIHAGMAEVFRTHGLAPLPFEMVRGFIGNGVSVLVSRCIRAAGLEETEALHAKMAGQFHDIYETAVNLTTLYPNVGETLQTLRSDGFHLGLCTNKPEAPTLAVLKHFGIERLFDAFAFGDGPYPHKPDPAPVRHVVDGLPARSFLYVGDSETDAETAQRAKLPMAIFTQGYRKTPIEQLYHDAHFDDFAELRPIIDRLAPLPE
ncbi:MAG: phosphoglycolate phosphatase [Rhodobacter sp.]|nr:phosphoglycolate phosphatase [Rhodobacter sp.]